MSTHHFSAHDQKSPVALSFDKKRARLTAMLAGGFALFMVGMAFAAVPLYNLFCAVTGYNGTVRVAEVGAGQTIDRDMTIRFDANVARDLAWTFRPAPKKVVKLGESHTVFYTATNNSHVPVTGTAVFNVVPFNAAAYFSKMQCFCFNEQTLQPGESVEMAVSFFVDPTLSENSDLDTLTEITLSYTMQHALDPEHRVIQAVEYATQNRARDTAPVELEESS